MVYVTRAHSQVPLPPDDLDTHHSYEWTGATVRTYNFCVPKPKKPKKAKKAKDGQEGEGGAEGGDAPEGVAAGQADGDTAQGTDQVRSPFPLIP